MNLSLLLNNQIEFIIWLLMMVERSGLSCCAQDGKFMIRHVSGLPLDERVMLDVIEAAVDEAERLKVKVTVSHESGKILVALGEANHEG